MTEPLLSVRDLCVDFITPGGPVRAVDRVSLDLHKGEILGLAGESGSGKSTFAQALLRILPAPAVIRGGEVRFEGQDLLSLDEGGLRKVRWTRISMVFQSAMDALNPVLKVGAQIADTIQAHEPVSADEARERAATLLEQVGIPRDRLDAFAHQLSGGMRQRVGIALALALEPSLVILDEPTTALDVIVEREILQEIRQLQRQRGFAVLFITHDLTRMLQFSDRVAIMYAARLAEVGPAAVIGSAPRHPYTQGLLRAFPSLHDEPGVVRSSIPGAPPRLASAPSGCRFAPRCPQAMPRCTETGPSLVTIAPDHRADCRLLD
jgi:peptide/nickel transport system ATP-binding protein